MLKKLLLLCGILVISTACGQKQAKTESSADAKVYGYITPGPDTWYKRGVEGFQAGAEKDGHEVIVLNSDYNVEKEIANIDSLIAQNVDGIAVFSFNENGAVIAAKKAAEAGIPIVAVDSVGSVFGKGADVVAAIDFDWYKMGEDYAQWMANNYPGEKFAIITGNFEAVPSQLVNKGMEDMSKKLGKNELLTVRAGRYDPSVAVNVAQDLIASGLDFTILFVMNEDMAAAVIRMLKEQGLLGKIKVIAQNGSPAGLPLIKDGTLSYTISSSPGWEGLVSYYALHNYVTGKNTELNQAIMLPIMPVNLENIDDKSKVVPWEVDPIFWELTKTYFPDMI